MTRPLDASIIGLEAAGIPLGGATTIPLIGAPGATRRYRVWAFGISFPHSAAAANVMARTTFGGAGHLAISATDRSDHVEYPGGLPYPVGVGISSVWWASAATSVNGWIIYTIEAVTP